MSSNRILIPLLALALAAMAPGQNCASSSTGNLPLNDLGTGFYQTLWQGGLYPSGSNQVPPLHQAAGVAQATAIGPLSPTGVPDPIGGKVVVLAVGPSFTELEFSQLQARRELDTRVRQNVVLVNAGQVAQGASVIADPSAAYWSFVDQQLAMAGVSPQQVQVIWLQEAELGPTGTFPAHAQALQSDLTTIVQILKQRYPHTRICYLSSRVYAGYATGNLGPEPYAYESGFAVKWLIEDQLNGDPALNFDILQGPVSAPWLAWGPYTWADGLVQRSDGLHWQCCQYTSNGTHLSLQGREVIGSLLHEFLTTDVTATPWFLGPTAQPTSAAVIPRGIGAYGAAGVPRGTALSRPNLGNSLFQVGLADAASLAPATLLVSVLPANIGFGCYAVFIDPGSLLLPNAFTPSTILTSPGGTGALTVPIPFNFNLVGLEAHAQWLVQDSFGIAFPTLGGFALSSGIRIRVGTL